MAFYKCVTYDPGTGGFFYIVPHDLSFSFFLFVNIIGPSVGGFIAGSLLVLRLIEGLRNKSYWYYILVNFLFFFSFVLVLNLVVPFIFYYREEIINANRPLEKAIELLLLNPYAIRNVVSWMIIGWLTMQGLKIYEKYTPSTLTSLLLGRYHRPHEVQRIFMFLDLSNSTSIAEKLGHMRFFALLKDFFSDMTDPILNSQGEIYQYVGDEIVISWPLRKSVIKNANYISCFFRIEKSIFKKGEYYLQEYGLLPVFKAAVHTGHVVVGEMGVIKREIVYSGDILNTTARMMEQCNIQNQKLIISEDIAGMIPEEKRKKYNLQPLGTMALRGKMNEVGLYGVEKKKEQL
ncbi:adenylate/guanylate cyclase domain-containing protein [Autumnicola musiva]|uniref:Adenylate/guanylate cyclase domain-containing protein n=1 Tax=Autumnicola musiva TaxID=3075589 RepID=A0ABU3DAR4_9FLAO|nr:adenylate/guanylate cyclase domain-containing protein [Zunongwangia sp. F117]MDT0678623.1 adenylate/guanylate cyclase domain-containing protein [Zunongwangia sp. F117]